MTLFISHGGANLAGVNAVCARKADGWKVRKSQRVNPDRSVDRGFVVTLLDRDRKPIGTL